MEKPAPGPRLSAWALLAFEGFLLTPLLVFGTQLVLGLLFARKLDSDSAPLLVTMALGAWGMSGVCYSCARHAWDTLRGRAEPEPLHWYGALILLTLSASVLWVFILVVASGTVR